MPELWIPPTANHTITCGFWCYPFHYADDLNAYFEPCWASRGGVVITADRNVVYGEREGMYVEMRHPNGVITRYFHLSRIDVSVGQQLAQRDPIGITGNTGYYWDSDAGTYRQYAPHLHWAMWFPTREMAIEAGWDNPQRVGNMWAASPMWITERQQEEDDILANITREEWNALVLKVDGLSTDVHNKANDVLVTMFRGRLPLAMVKTDSSPDVFGIFVHRNDNGVLLIRRHHVGNPFIFALLNGAFGELRTNLYGDKAPLVETITDAEMNAIKIGNQLDLTL